MVNGQSAVRGALPVPVTQSFAFSLPLPYRLGRRIRMKLLLTAVLALFAARPAFAQLAPVNEAGVTFGHVHLSVADPEVHKKMWVEQFGGVISTKGTFTIVKLPNMMIAFRATAPTGGIEDTALNHFGLKVRSMAEALAKWKAAGYQVQREFKGSEGFPNAFLIGPDGLRFELQEDTTLKVPAVAYHLHYQLPEAAKLRDWYAEMFGLTKGKSGNFETAEAPGVRLLFANNQTAPAGGTRGKTIDHIGFEVKNLAEFIKKLEAKGIKMDVAYREVPAIGLNIAYLTDPTGVYIELTDGYDKY
jgi:catechol 2,3-dioxygenase-like lactoylglutathione lyase family enzyme